MGTRLLVAATTTGPTDKLTCMKHLPFGIGKVQLDQNECIRRLKRWFVVGNMPSSEERYNPLMQRRDHLGLGGGRLTDYSSDGGLLYDICGDDLNTMCAAVPPP